MSKVFELFMEIVEGTIRWTNPILWLLAGTAVLLVFTTVRGAFKSIRRRHQNKLFRLGLHDIGELAVEEGNTTQIYCDKDAMKLFGKDLPLTRKRLILTSDVRFKVGYDFDQIDATVNDRKKEITLRIPAAKYISKELMPESERILDQYCSLFNKYDPADYNYAQRIMLQDAQKKVEESGIFERAENSMKNRLHAFMSQFYDMRKYSLRFIFAPTPRVPVLPNDVLPKEAAEVEAQCA